MEHWLNKDLQVILADYYQGDRSDFPIDPTYQNLLSEQIRLQQELLNVAVISKEQLKNEILQALKQVETQLYAHPFHVEYCKNKQLSKMELAYLKKYVEEKYERIRDIT